MARLIDADALPSALFQKHVHYEEELEPMLYFEDAVNVVENAPTIDAIPVVRCRDCKYYDRRCFTCENDVLLIKIDDCGCHPPFRVDDDWFCADGERRDEDGQIN